MAELSNRRLRPARSIARWPLPLGLALTCMLASREASAQLHWDASAQVGVMKRMLGSRPAGAEDVGFGPTGQVTGHVALLPLVRIGGYFGHDISPLPGDGAARNITFGGIRAKGMLPWIRGSAQAWVFAGFGYSGVYSQSYTTTFAIPTGTGAVERRPGRVEGAGGSFFDVPFGLGAAYKLFKPWALTAELGARVGFGYHGSVYNAPGPQVTVPDQAGQNVTPAGLDRFAVGLTLGVLADF